MCFCWTVGRVILIRKVLIGFCLSFAFFHAATAAAPSQLYGKSVVIALSEQRSHRAVGGSQVVNITTLVRVVAYVSSNGRVFVRADRSISSGGGHVDIRIDSEPGNSASGVGKASAQFSGSSLAITVTFGSGARRITANFDNSFSSCSATVVEGKEGGKHMIINSRLDGQKLEILSIDSHITGCSVSAGNAL
jgi:hypothetical protein